MPNYEFDRQEAVNWAARKLENKNNWLILDTETTGLADTAEVVEICVLHPAYPERPLFQATFKPTSRASLEPRAFEVNGLREEMLAGSVAFASAYPAIASLLAGKTIVIYNEGYDIPRLAATCKNSGLLPFIPKAECAMLWYSQFVGEWNYQHGNYKRQKLPGGGHTAFSDCVATLKIIEKMAQAGNQQEAEPQSKIVFGNPEDFNLG